MRFAIQFVMVALCLSTSYGDELVMMQAPQGMKLASSLEQRLDSNEVSSFITYLMGFSSTLHRQLKGVSVDMFHPPSANLLVNVHLPADRKMKFADNNLATYEVDNKFGEATSLEETNEAIHKNYDNSVMMDSQDLSQNKIFGSLPTNLADMRRRFENSDLKFLMESEHLNKEIDADFLLYAEVQFMWDVLEKLRSNKDLVDDESPDSYLISLSSVDRLADEYGSNSPQVDFAIKMLETIIPQYINSMQELYKGKLLAEVKLSGPVQHEFHQVLLERSRRDVTVEPAAANKTIKGRVEANKPDQIVIMNIAIWITVVMVLATLGTAYPIWYMDPGRDSVIYRMTSHRMKID